MTMETLIGWVNMTTHLVVALLVLGVTVLGAALILMHEWRRLRS